MALLITACAAAESVLLVPSLLLIGEMHLVKSASSASVGASAAGDAIEEECVLISISMPRIFDLAGAVTMLGESNILNMGSIPCKEHVEYTLPHSLRDIVGKAASLL